MHNLCRLCALEKVYRIPIFDENCIDVANRIESLVKVTVTANDVLPKTICTECLAQVNNFNDFIIKCTQAQYVLKTLSQNSFNDIQQELNAVDVKIEENSVIDLCISGDDVSKSYNFIEIEVLPDKDGAKQDDEEAFESNIEKFEPDNISDIIEETLLESNEDIAETPTIGIKQRSTSYKIRQTRAIFRQLRCCECNVIKCGPKQLQLHFRLNHSQNVTYSCPNCSKKFEKYRSFTRHVLLHSEGHKFSCDICQKTFAQKVQLQNHITVHADNTPYQCEDCGKEYRQLTSLYKHIRQHVGYKAICDICYQEFASKDTLRNHKRAFHINEKKEICLICDEKFSTKPALYYHMKVHKRNNSRQYTCTICMKFFYTTALLQRHQRSCKPELMFDVKSQPDPNELFKVF